MKCLFSFSKGERKEENIFIRNLSPKFLRSFYDRNFLSHTKSSVSMALYISVCVCVCFANKSVAYPHHYCYLIIIGIDIGFLNNSHFYLLQFSGFLVGN